MEEFQPDLSVDAQARIVSSPMCSATAYTSTTLFRRSMAFVSFRALKQCRPRPTVKLPPFPASASGYKVVGIVASKLPGGSAAVLSIPQSVEYIDGDAFVNYKELECIECEAAVPPVIIGSPFSTQTYANVRLQVPAGSLEAYRAAPVWNKFKNMVEEGVLGAVPVESAAVSVSVLDGDIVVSGKADGSAVTVLDLSGRCVAKGTAGRVSGLGAGVYIVAVDGAVPVKVTL